LPEQPPGGSTPTGDGFRLHDGVYVCGDHCSSASIEGALISGRSVAENIIATNPRFLRDELEQVAPEHFHLED
jgi:hypothetical protein